MSTTAEPPVTFIPAKRRKLAQNIRRKRSQSPPAAPTSEPEVSLQRPRVRHRFGLEVSSSTPTNAADGGGSGGGLAEDRALEAETLAVVNRFTHQTGQVTDVDKHMMAYVEQEMSRRRGETTVVSPETAAAAAAAQGGGADDERRQQRQKAGKGSYWAPTRPEARGATLGKLHEVDLGEEVKQRNIALTAQALTGGGGEGQLESGAASGGRRRQRRRRNSQDIERDRLVEEVLKETRLDLYPEDAAEEEDRDEEGAADDKIAEKFRKEFIDAILSKRRRRGADPKTKGKKEDKKRPKGPKLGGSRMARAQMREQQQGQSGGSGPSGPGRK